MVECTSGIQKGIYKLKEEGFKDQLQKHPRYQQDAKKNLVLELE